MKVVHWVAPILLTILIAGCGAASAASPSSTPPPAASPKNPSPNHIVLSPNQGPPGTLVTVRGNLPSVAKDPKLKTLTGNIILGSMNLGFRDEAITVRWSTVHPGDFTMEFRMPITAWLTPKGEHRLSDGPISVGIQCMGQSPEGCDAHAPAIHANFDITGSIPKEPSAPFLQFTPNRAKAGTIVHISGWAPLSTVIGQPFGYQLQASQNGTIFYGQLGQVTQQFNGTLSGTFRVPASIPPWEALLPGKAEISLSYVFLTPQKSVIAPIHNAKGAGSITFAPTAFYYESSPQWSNFSSSAPIQIETNTNALSFAAPTPVAVSGKEIVAQSAYLGPLWESNNGGTTWHSLSLQSLIPLTSAAGFPSVWSNGQTAPQASSITLDPTYPQSLFVAVTGVLKKYDEAPPIYNLPAYSTNGGSTWHLVPAPSGMNLGDFGGFIQNSQGVFAYFAKNGIITTEQTTDGGKSWHVLPLAQAAPQSSLVWGPVPDQNNGQMGGFTPQSVLYKNANDIWRSTATVGLLQGPSNIALMPHQQALLISGSSSYPVQFSTTGGASWQNLTIPTPPNATTEQSPYQRLLILPNRSLLALVNQNTGSAWFLLPPQATQWQAVPQSVLPTAIGTLTITNKGVWWNTSNPADENEPPVIHHVLDSQL